jgi:putative FmdB family regulatory protein
MPTYEYRCDKCGEEFSRFLSLREHGTAKVNCPKCNSPEVKQQVSKFVARVKARV